MPPSFIICIICSCVAFFTLLSAPLTTLKSMVSKRSVLPFTTSAHVSGAILIDVMDMSPRAVTVMPPFEYGTTIFSTSACSFLDSLRICITCLMLSKNPMVLHSVFFCFV